MVASIITPTLTGNQLYVPEPLLQEEKAVIWKSQVLIPFTICEITHAFSGPFPDINTNMAKVSEFFSCYDHIFCFTPYTNQTNYTNWLDKVESQKGQF